MRDHSFGDETHCVTQGSGNLGTAIVRSLVDAGFAVTAVSRASSTSTFPEGVAVKKVDFGSLEEVQSAFAGNDAVVSTIATLGVGAQQVIVDAALAAHVVRFIPSEFGINTRVAAGTPIGKILAGKVAVVDYLSSKAKENPWFSWTGISTGLFFDWVGFPPSSSRIPHSRVNMFAANERLARRPRGLKKVPSALTSPIRRQPWWTPATRSGRLAI